jgi:hypothetical protein
MARITVESLVSVVNDIESEDPIDWGMLAVDENSAIELLANSILDQYNTTWSQMPADDKDLIMLATITKLVAENFTLNLKLRQ